MQKMHSFSGMCLKLTRTTRKNSVNTFADHQHKQQQQQQQQPPQTQQQQF
jgi:hypothetical protein